MITMSAGAPRSEAPAIHIDREVCRDHARSSRLEWLETNGTGGFAMGTVSGTSTRRYHGLLVAALRAPVDRAVLLSRVEETVEVEGRRHELASAQYPGVVAPAGHLLLEEFRLDPFPTWTWRAGPVVIEKRVFLVQGQQTVAIEYRASAPCRLLLRPMIAYRDFHALTRENVALDGRLAIERRSPDRATLRITPYLGMPALSLHHSGSASAEGACWYRDVEYLEELDRGLDFREDLWCLGTVDTEVAPRRSAWLVATTSRDDGWDRTRVAAEMEIERERRRVPGRDGLTRRLAVAANAYRVRRADGTPTVIAGYPWFADWGRDTMIALPGLLIARGLLDEARDVMAGFLGHLDRGLVPNRFVEGAEVPEYNTVDGTLWLFQAVRAWLEAGGDRRWALEVFLPRARGIIAWHVRGTHHGIRVDDRDGLLVAGGPGTQLTWMDAKVGDQVMTPRDGKPVEVNALWIAALRLVAELARAARDEATAADAEERAERAARSFAAAFWNPALGCLHDVVRDDGVDARVRPNQIFAVSLLGGPWSGGSPLTMEQQRSVVRVVEERLLTPRGLRTLAPGEDGYLPRYQGGPRERDGAYHQGTVWPWLLGPFVTAALNAHGRTPERIAWARALLGQVEEQVAGEGCLGQIGEVFDADAPHGGGGAVAQAWSVAELLRLQLTELA